MSRKSINVDCIKEYMEKVDKLYFNGYSLAASIEKASDILPRGTKGRVTKWLKKNLPG